MKVNLVSYANDDFIRRQKKLSKSALRFGVDKVFSYTEDMIKDTDFYKQNEKILKKEKGTGYWIWKPYVILQAISKINYGDILIYSDSGAEVISDISPLVKLCKKEKGILLFSAINKNKFWTKRDCFILMGCDYEKYWEHTQFMGGYQVYMKNKRSLSLLKEYLKYVQIPIIVNDSKTLFLNSSGFVEHRHDQSILTNLAIRYGVKGFRNPSQGGNHLKKKELRVKGEYLQYPYVYSETPDLSSDYPTIFFNKRNAGFFKLFLIKLHSKLPIKLKLLLRDLIK